MKKLLLISLAFAGMLGVSAQDINDPNAEVREAKNFHAINISNAFDVFLSQGNEEAVAVSASEKKFQDHIKVSVEDGVLKIRFENDDKFWKGLGGNKMKLKVYISFKAIDRLTASGACDLVVKGVLKADKLDIALSGASDMKGKLDVQDLAVVLSGASDMQVTGNAMKLKVDANGASDFKSFDLLTDYCEATASGASDIHVTVNKELTAHASGASDINYKGSGMVKDVRSNGASSVSHKS
jgi:hypothetical protein